MITLLGKGFFVYIGSGWYKLSGCDFTSSEVAQ
jgi:hypothetical protein